MTTPSPHPDEIRFDPSQLMGTRMDPKAVSRLAATARAMLAACEGPIEHRPVVTGIESVDEPGCSVTTMANDDATIALVCPLSAPEGHEASSLLRLVIRACEAMTMAAVRSTEEAQAFVTAIFTLSKIGSLAIGSGTIHGGTGSIVHGPSPFGPAFILDTVQGRERRAVIDTGLPTAWTAYIHCPNAGRSSITLQGVSYEPDPDDIEDPITTMREIARTGIGPALEILRNS